MKPARLLRCVLLVVAVALQLPAVRARAVTISIDPSAMQVGPGKSFSVDVGIADVSDLFALQFNLGFDLSVLSATSIVEGPFLPSGGEATFFTPGAINNTVGEISLTSDTLIGAVGGVAGSGVLATATFMALALGSSPLHLSDVILLNSDLADIPAAVRDGGVIVSTAAVVPEPGTLVLVGIGIAVAGWWCKRQQKRSQRARF